ncbi:MAG: LOG family protein [Anaerolineae bacterium]|nr:LOG family protein [Chloroflexota bacterium]MBP6298713.1 LOG family protein [Anaerolineae bacterium]
MKTVAVFGSALPTPDSPIYQTSREIGRLLGEAGYAVMTGGYNGLMAAASQGAHEAGAKVIGATCLSLERQRGSKPNPWVTEIIARESLRDRLMVLVDVPDAYVLMPGGLGTLNELVFASESMRSGDITRRPLVCYGDFWRPIVEMVADSGYMHHQGWGSLDFANSPEHIVELISAHVPR